MKRNLLHSIAVAFFLATFSLQTFFINDIQAQTGYPEIDTTKLNAHYDFLGSFRDSTGINVAAVANEAELTEDRFCHPQSAVYLTKTSSYLEVEDHSSLDFSDPMSISFRVYLNSLPETETRIISKSDPAKPDSGSYWISIHPGEPVAYGTPWSFSFTDTDGNIQSFKCEWGMLIEQWAHYTVTFDGSMVTMYLDSEPCAEFEVSSPAILPNDDPLWFGNSVGSGITGKLDDILLYERVIQIEELESIRQQSILWPDTERPSLGTCVGGSIELVSNAGGPFLQYTFMKDGEVIQEGADSICSVQIQTESDFGEYSCITSNCMDSSTMYFDVEESYTVGDLVIMDLTQDKQAYENEWVGLVIEVGEWDTKPHHQWYHYGNPVGQDRRVHAIKGFSASDTGYYYCETTSQCNRIYSDSIHVTLLRSDQSPPLDTFLIKAYYAFNGNYRDSTGNTGPAINNSVELDTGLFSIPDRSASFTGAASYLEIPDDPDLDIADQLTIAFALRVDSVPEGRGALMAKTSGSTDTVGNYALFIDSDLLLVFSVTAENGEVYEHISESALQPGKWHLLTATFNGTEINTYVDGVPGTPLPVAESLLRTDDHPLIIGRQGESSMSCDLSDLRIFQRVLDFEEISQYQEMHLPRTAINSQSESACHGDTIEFNSSIWGPFVSYSFSKDGVVLQEGFSPMFAIPVSSDEDFGEYRCDASNGYQSAESIMVLESGKIIDNVQIEYHYSTEISASTGDKVEFSFYVAHDVVELDIEMYHNGKLLPGVRKKVTLDPVTSADSGDYYLVVVNGCERIVSDTIHVIVESPEYVNYQVVGWDWTGNISSSGSSYFSSICTGNDGSFYLLGHYGGGLKVEDTEVFSSGTDDIFIVKYAENGDYLWSNFLTSSKSKGKGDLAVDSEGNVYVSGSFRESIQIGEHTLTTALVAGSGYLAKYNPSGRLLWIRELESTRGVMCDNIEIDPNDQIYLGGNFSGNLTIDTLEVSGTWDTYANVMFVARMDTAGSCEWISHAITDPYMDIFGLIDMDLSPSGQLVTAGTYTDMVDFGNRVTLSTPVEAPFLVQFDEAGVAQWGTTITTEFGFAEAFDVSVDDQGRIFMTGMHLGDVGFGEFMVENEGMVMEEIFLARFDPAGECTSLNSYGSEGEGGDFGVSYEPATDTTGYLLGMFGDTLVLGLDTLVAQPASSAGGVSPNMFIAKLTDGGEPMVMKSAGVRGHQFFGEIKVTEEGRLYFAGLNEGVSFKKASAEEAKPVAFVGFLENGITERTEAVEVYVNTQETICLGDSIKFRGLWCSEAGLYTDRIQGTDGIDSVYTMELVTEICNSVEEDFGIEDYVIYPNPANQVLYVTSPDKEPFELHMFGMSGKLMLLYSDQSVYELNVQDYQPGIYFLKLIKSEGSTVHKVLIE